MRLPLELAMEVGSFLSRHYLLVCATQLCTSGMGFVANPRIDLIRTTTILLHQLIPLCRYSYWTLVKRACTRRIAQECIKRIELCLARRTHTERVILVANLRGELVHNQALYSGLQCHFKEVAYLQVNTSKGLAIEWHADAGSLLDVGFLLGPTPANSGQVLVEAPGFGTCLTLHKLDICHSSTSDVSALASCEALHTLDLGCTRVVDISALASCAALHTLTLWATKVSDVSALAACRSLQTLDLWNTPVNDVTALASCQSLHSLYLTNTQVSDVSALASCQSLHTLNLNSTQMSDVSALALCQSLHTLNLNNTQVRDVSAFASCQSLHTLNLNRTQVSDVSALASCQSLRNLYGASGMGGYEHVEDVIASRR
jgi:hypothetical protein